MVDGRVAQLLGEIEILERRSDDNVAELSALVKAHESGSVPAEAVHEKAEKGSLLARELEVRLAELQALTGLTDEVLDELEERTRPASDAVRLWRGEIGDAPVTWNLRDLTAAALAKLLPLAPPTWLRGESAKLYRLGPDFRAKPFHLVSGIHLSTGTELARPQHFAEMLLVGADFVEDMPAFDFYAAPTLLGELAALGMGVEPLEECGDEARRKLHGLPTINTREVPSLIYELLVAAALVRRGFSVEMIPSQPGRKSPDIRIAQKIPTTVECKRRLGLSVYQLAEAAHVERLFAACRHDLEQRPLVIECTFLVEAVHVDISSFRDVVGELLCSPEGAPMILEWAAMKWRSLPQVSDVALTPLYSPNFLSDVFGWSGLEEMWDGILCEVSPPETLLVDRARNPRCLKWASVSETAIVKKSRGITSLWSDAVRQIPAGEFGFIYIAYPEGGRPHLADKRTQDIQDKCGAWYHRWHVNIPLSVVNRLYGRPLLDGTPDIIENSMRVVTPGFEDSSLDYPMGIFAPERMPRDR